MDLITLSINMDKDPTIYKLEFRKQVNSFRHLLNLQKQPEKLIRQTADFLLKYAKLDPEIPELFLEGIKKAKTHKLKSSLIAANFSLIYKKLLNSNILIKTILDEVPDCTKYINKTKSIIQESDSDLIIEYYKNGSEKQKNFCYFFICFLFEKYQLPLYEFICSGLFENIKIKKYSYMHFLENIKMKNLPDECKKYGKMLYQEIIDKKEEREYLILKMRVYGLFRNRFDLKNSIIPLALSMIDPDKEDIKDLMSLIVECINKKEVMNVVKIICDTFCSPHKEDDLICYGLNLLRSIYAKFDSSVETEEDSAEISEIEESIEDECEDSYNNENTRNKKSEDKFCEMLKEEILNNIECFQGVKSKSITYAYNAVINVVKKKRNPKRDINFILKKLSKEERLEKYKKAYTKEERKELFMKKSKRKFKLSKTRIKKNKINKKK